MSSAAPNARNRVSWRRSGFACRLACSAQRHRWSGGRARGNPGDDDRRQCEIAPNGNVVVADTGNDQVAEYTSTGAKVWRIGSPGTAAKAGNVQFQQPRDVGVNSSGNV